MDKRKWEAAAAFVKNNLWLLLMLLAGLSLLLLPGGDAGKKSGEDGDLATVQEQRLSDILSHMKGVGEAKVLLAEKPGREQGFSGAVIICSGAEDPGVRLRIVEAVSAFTGLGSNRIVVEKLIS